MGRASIMKTLDGLSPRHVRRAAKKNEPWLLFALQGQIFYFPDVGKTGAYSQKQTGAEATSRLIR